MGRATIVSGGTDGLYTIELDYGAAERDAKVVKLTALLAELEDRRIWQQEQADGFQGGLDSFGPEMDALISAYVVLSNTVPQDAAAMAAMRRQIDDKTALIIKQQLWLAEALASLRMTEAQIVAATAERAALLALPVVEQRAAWCADYTDTATGAVGTLEVPGESALILVSPAAPAPLAADGVLKTRELQAPYQVYWNAAVLPGWQKFKPTYRSGTITAIDYAADTASVALDAALSSAQSLDVNQATALEDVAVQYMSCNAAAFVVGDVVIVKFTAQDWAQPVLIGFKDHPRTCPLRGFVITPLWVDSATPDPALDKNILVFMDDDNRWGPYGPAYSPGVYRGALSYRVAADVWTGLAGPVDAGNYTLWAGSAINNKRPLSDAKFNDVYAIKSATLYKNGLAATTWPVAPVEGFPGVFVADGVYSVTVATDTMIVGYLGATPVIAYNWNTVSEFIVPGEEFRSGVEIEAAGPLASVQYRAHYLAYNITLPGAVQTWVASVDMLQGAPFAAVDYESLNQLNVSGALADGTGWTTTGSEAYVPAETTFAIIDASVWWVGHTYQKSGASSYLTGTVTSVDYAGRPGECSRSRYFFEKTYALPETMLINGSESLTITRGVVVDGKKYHNTAAFYGRIPTGTVTTVVIGPSGLDTYTVGDYVNLAASEISDTMQQTDESECKVEVPDAPRAIWDMTCAHAITMASGGHMEYTGREARFGPGPVSILADAGGYTLSANEDHTAETWRVGENVEVETFELVAWARDYVYSDRANQVFAWIECEITSSNTITLGEVAGTSAITVRWCIKFNGTEHKADLWLHEYDAPRFVSTMQPWGIDFGTDPQAFRYHAPARPHPIYAPKWCDQGLCPWLAYTVEGEGPDGAAVTPRIAAHFRLQLERRYRGVDEPELPFIEDVVGFSPYMMQQLLETYGGAGGVDSYNVVRDVFNALEASPVVMKLTEPDAGLFANVGAPLDPASEYAKFYRT